MISKALRNIIKLNEHYRTFGWQGIMLILNRRKTKDITLNIPQSKTPIYLRGGTTDTTVFYQVFLAKSYEIKVESPIYNIIDCGANVGLASIFFKNKFPNAQVIAIEPETDNFRRLEKNMQSYSDVHCLNYGVWNNQAFLKINNDFDSEWAFTVQEVMSKDEADVEAISIKEIIHQYQLESIDILKIDIEGAEKALFSTNFEAWLKITKIIIIELHDSMAPGATKSFFTAINNYDYRMSRNNENLIIYFN